MPQRRDPVNGLWVGCWRAGEERPNPENESLRWLAGESCLGLLYCMCIKPTNVVSTGLSLVGP